MARNDDRRQGIPTLGLEKSASRSGAGGTPTQTLRVSEARDWVGLVSFFVAAACPLAIVIGGAYASVLPESSYSLAMGILPMLVPVGILAAILAYTASRHNDSGLASVAVVLGLITPLVALSTLISVPGTRSARERGNTRACFANQKTISGAMEMYNLDKKTHRTDLPGFIASLVSGHYLQSTPDDPGQGWGSSSNYQYTPCAFNVTCTKHGPIQHCAEFQPQPAAARTSGPRIRP